MRSILPRQFVFYGEWMLASREPQISDTTCRDYVRATPGVFREALECARRRAAALGGRWNRDDSQRLMLAQRSAPHIPPPSQSGGSVATALQSFAKCAACRASIKHFRAQHF